MQYFVQRSELRDLYEKVAGGARISESEALRLFESKDLNTLGAMADLVRERKVGNRATYILNRYILLQGLQVGQLAACNRLHEVDERLARWLLMSHDRADGNAFPITHDQLARMLGSGRPSVTVAAGGLQRAGVIEYKRGRIRVVNREGLEHAACECYDAMRRIYTVKHGPVDLEAQL